MRKEREQTSVTTASDEAGDAIDGDGTLGHEVQFAQIIFCVLLQYFLCCRSLN